MSLETGGGWNPPAIRDLDGGFVSLVLLQGSCQGDLMWPNAERISFLRTDTDMRGSRRMASVPSSCNLERANFRITRARSMMISFKGRDMGRFRRGASIAPTDPCRTPLPSKIRFRSKGGVFTAFSRHVEDLDIIAYLDMRERWRIYLFATAQPATRPKGPRVVTS